MDDRGASNVVGFAVAFGVFALAFSFSVTQFQEPARVAAPAGETASGLHAADAALDLLFAKPGQPADWFETGQVPVVPGLRHERATTVALERVHALARGDVAGVPWTYEDARLGLGVPPGYFRLRVVPVVDSDLLAQTLAGRRLSYVGAAGAASAGERAALAASGIGYVNETVPATEPAASGDAYTDADALTLSRLPLRLLGYEGAVGAGLVPVSRWTAVESPGGSWVATPSRVDGLGAWNYTHGEDSRLVLGFANLANLTPDATVAIDLEAIVSPTTLVPLLGAALADAAEVEACAVPCAGSWTTLAALPARETLGPVAVSFPRPASNATLFALRWNGSRLAAPPPGALVTTWGQGFVIASARVASGGTTLVAVEPDFESTRVDAIVFGSDANHAALAATEDGRRFGRAIQAWVAAGGGLLLMPSSHADGTLFSPDLTTANPGQAGATPGAYLDAFDGGHPLLTFPHALAHGLYGNATPRWLAAAQGGFHEVLTVEVTGAGRAPLVEARGGDLTTGAGPVIVSSARPPQAEAQAFFENALAWILLDDLTIDYGPSVPRAAALALRERTVWIDAGPAWGVVNARVQIVAWR